MLFDVAAWWRLDPFQLAERPMAELIEAHSHAARINALRQES